MHKISRFTSDGFTLVEMLVVVLIIGILSTMAISHYRKAVEKSRLVAVLPMATALRNSLDEQILEGLNERHLNYLGGTEIGRDLLMTVPKCQLRADEENGPCHSKYFSYRVWCSEIGCFIAIIRWNNKDEDLYGVLWRKVLTNWNDYPIGVWEVNCMAHSDIGYEVCRSMASHGWKVSDERPVRYNE